MEMTSAAVRRVTTAIVAATLLGAAESNAEPTQSKPNVLFLICDDLNCDLGVYGHPTVRSPHIDRLAARGVRFANAHCQYPLCGPSRASFLTGLYPDQTLVHRNGVYVRERVPNVQTLPQMFRRQGYFATRIGKLYHYGVPRHIGTSGHDDPFSWDYTINPRGRDKDDEDLIFSLRPGSFGGTLSWLAAEGTDSEQTDGIAASDAVRLLEEYAREKIPFFLAVGLYRPHTPYVAPKKYFDMYPLETIAVPKVPAGYRETLPEPAQRALTRKREQVDLAADVARKAIQAYYASITFADAQLGRILDALERTGLAETTIVVFTSDHGYHMGEHGHYQKTTLFENATRVPLIIAGPGVPAAGASSDAPVEMVDLYPTLAELCGLDAPEILPGLSLSPALRDPSVRLRGSAFSQYATGYSVRTPRYRYTEWGKAGADGVELYDHSRDPGETKNLADHSAYAATARSLAQLLRERIAEASTPPEGIQQIPVKARRRVPQTLPRTPRPAR